MTSEGFGEMFEGDWRHVRRKISAYVDAESGGGPSMSRPKSNDPYRRERICINQTVKTLKLT